MSACVQPATTRGAWCAPAHSPHETTPCLRCASHAPRMAALHAAAGREWALSLCTISIKEGCCCAEDEIEDEEEEEAAAMMMR